MSSLNKVQLIGRLGADPEVKYMQSGDAVCNFSLATSETWKDKSTGERKEATEWHRITMYGRVAEVAGEYLRKGSLVYLEGKNKTRKWTDKDGVERYTTEVQCNEMKMLGSKAENGGEAGGGRPAQQRPAAKPQQQPPQKQADLDDDIPF